MTSIDWIPLLGAVGVGAIATKLLDVVWLQRVIHNSERRRWLREARYSVFGKLTREIIVYGPLHYSTGSTSLEEIIADAILLVDEPTLLSNLERYVPTLEDTQRRLSELPPLAAMSPEDAKIEGRRRDAEMRELGEKVVQGLRALVIG